MSTITKTHEDLAGMSLAVYSECERYRYRLTRIWDPEAPRFAAVMLNPSTATELDNDPTIERIQRRAIGMGYGSIDIANLFAFRATSPEDMKAQEQPIGAENDHYLLKVANEADLLIFGWGTDGDHMNRQNEVIALLDGFEFHAIDTTKAGWPMHPLYLAYDKKPAPWSPPK